MVIPLAKATPYRRQRREAALLMTELVVSIAFLCIAVIPLAFSFAKERQYLRSNYHHAVALEIVDGEMELLVAGEWRSYSNGVYHLTSPAAAAANLPPGSLQLTVTNKHLTLEWSPKRRHQGGPIRCEVILP